MVWWQIAEAILYSTDKRYKISDDDLLGFIPGKANANIVYISDTKRG